VRLPDFRSFVVADIPGIIEGAHEGKGLGLQFLRHLERTRTLAFLVPVDSADPQAEYDLLRSELQSHSESLARVAHCLVLTKADLLAPGEGAPAVRTAGAWGTFVISAVSRRGLGELLEALWARTREEVSADRVEGEEEWWTP
jgi:GTP-binding protein